MHHLETYYLNQAGRVLPSAPGIGPIHSAPIYLQRGNGIGNYLCTVFRIVRPLLWTVDRTDGKIITDTAKNKSPDVTAEDISKHVGDAVTESTRHLVSKLRDRGLKRAKRVAPKMQAGKKPQKTPAKHARVIKGISSPSVTQSNHVCCGGSVH